jgi:myo-inositol-1(or 4)-monophosphatase
VDVATAAGALLAAGWSGPRDVSTKSTPTDIVTEMDRASEDLIGQRLLTLHPQDGILGEESGERVGTTGRRWIVDPLDGTVNYLYGLAHWAVSVALEQEGRIIAGAVAAPVLGEVFAAGAGLGAWRQTWQPDPGGTRAATLGTAQRVHPSTVDTLDQALVATGFSYSAQTRIRQGALVSALLPEVRDLRRLGAAALDLCHVACGRVDAYVEEDLQAWDLAAGGLIAREAGAHVAGVRGRAAPTPLTVAAAPGIATAFGALVDAVVVLSAHDVPGD